MTVKELIEALATMPQNVDVVYDGYQGMSDVTSVELTSMNAQYHRPELDVDTPLVMLV
jgi:hypothetical protein